MNILQKAESRSAQASRSRTRRATMTDEQKAESKTRFNSRCPAMISARLLSWTADENWKEAQKPISKNKEEI